MLLNLYKIANFSFLLPTIINNKFKCECLTQITKETRIAL